MNIIKSVMYLGMGLVLAGKDTFKTQTATTGGVNIGSWGTGFIKEEVMAMENKMTTQLLFTELDVMAALHLSRTAVIKLRSEGKLVPVKIGRSIRYKKADISAFVDQLVVDRG